MGSRITALAILGVFLISVGGCATTGKKESMEVQGLKNQVTALETQLQSKDAEIQSLKEQSNSSVSMPTEERTSAPAVTKKPSEGKMHYTNKDIQTALKNANYYSGTIDGKMGKNTQSAIKAFQKANNLKADGHVGKQTWSLLKEYLDKKAE